MENPRDYSKSMVDAASAILPKMNQGLRVAAIASAGADVVSKQDKLDLKLIFRDDVTPKSRNAAILRLGQEENIALLQPVKKPLTANDRELFNVDLGLLSGEVSSGGETPGSATRAQISDRVVALQKSLLGEGVKRIEKGSEEYKFIQKSIRSLLSVIGQPIEETSTPIPNPNPDGEGGVDVSVGDSKELTQIIALEIPRIIQGGVSDSLDHDDHRRSSVALANKLVEAIEAGPSGLLAQELNAIPGGLSEIIQMVEDVRDATAGITTNNVKIDGEGDGQIIISDSRGMVTLNPTFSISSDLKEIIDMEMSNITQGGVSEEEASDILGRKLRQGINTDPGASFAKELISIMGDPMNFDSGSVSDLIKAVRADTAGITTNVGNFITNFGENATRKIISFLDENPYHPTALSIEKELDQFTVIHDAEHIDLVVNAQVIASESPSLRHIIKNTPHPKSPAHDGDNVVQTIVKAIMKSLKSSTRGSKNLRKELQKAIGKSNMSQQEIMVVVRDQMNFTHKPRGDATADTSTLSLEQQLNPTGSDSLLNSVLDIE